jgi:hypothetical protein
MCSVIDGFFDHEYLYEIYNQICDMPVCITNVANRKTFPYGHEGTHRLMGETIFSRSSVNRIDTLHPSSKIFFDIFEGISERIQNSLYLAGIYTNVQHNGCNGTTHTDGRNDNEYTIIVMTNPVWDDSWSGEFQVMHDFETVLETYKYVPGRIVIVPGNQPHRALGPKKEYVYRTSIAYRVEILDRNRLTILD